jgi:acetylornithine deacetylase
MEIATGNDELKAKVLEQIELDEIVDLLGKLIRIPSFTEQETDVARLLDGLFVEAGLSSELQEIEPGRFQTVGRLRGGGGGRSLMLNGHLDIDPLPAGATGRDPWQPTIEGDRLYGAGAFNMKCGVASMIVAALAAKRAELPLRGDVVLACVAGELQGGIGSTYLVESGVTADMAVVTEPVGSPLILSKQGGLVQPAVHVEGRQAHVCAAHNGVNAATKAVKAVVAIEGLQLQVDPDPDLPAIPSVNVGGMIVGHGADYDMRGAYMLPDRATIYLDIRYPEGIAEEEVIGQLDEVLAAVGAEDPEFEYEIEFPVVGREVLRQGVPPVSLPEDAEVIQLLKRNVKALAGIEPYAGAVLPGSYTTTDIAHLIPAGIPAATWGPGWGPDYHVDERSVAVPEDGWGWVSLNELLLSCRVYAAMIVDVCA